MSQTTVTGMILSATPMGEYDKRIVLLTKEKGKLSAFAKGARRPNSPLVGVTSPFCFGTFSLYEGRTAYTMQEASVEKYFERLRTDVKAAYYGFYFLEMADYYAREYNDERALLKLLYQTMRALEKGRISCELIRCVYELKFLCIEGEGPGVFTCMGCGMQVGTAVEQPVIFSPAKHGVLCEKCKREVRDGIALDTSTLYTLQFIVSSSIEKLYTFTVSEEVLHKLQRLLERYMQIHVGHHFKSEEMIRILDT